MVTKTSDELIVARANVFFAPFGSPATTAVGYKSGPVQCSYKEKTFDIEVEDRDLPIGKETSGAEGFIKFKTVQMNPTLFSLAMGLSENGNIVGFGGAPVTKLEYAIKVVSQLRNGSFITFYAPKTVSDRAIVLDFDKKKMSELDQVFHILDTESDTDKAAWYEFGAGNITATLASGVLTRTAAAGYHQVLGQGGVADVLDSITGASLTDGETLRLQISSVNSPITLTHLTDTLELTGSVDWTMTKLNDYIDLQYSSTKTGWVEIGRYDAIA